MTVKRGRITIKDKLVFDPFTMTFIQKEHIVHKKKILNYPIHQCKKCGNDFPRKRRDQEFCNDDCRNAWHRNKYHSGKLPDLIERICPICLNTFIPTRSWSKYCCDECRAESRRLKLVEQRQSKSLSELLSVSVR